MIIAKHSAEMAPSIVVQSIDRSPIALRQLTHQDARAVADLHDQLTEQDRYMRFFSTHPKDLGDLTDSLTTQSKSQLSVGAFDGRRLIGVANYAISRANSAEVALVVAHADQHRGIGTMLLKHLAELPSETASRVSPRTSSPKTTRYWSCCASYDCGTPSTRLIAMYSTSALN